MALLTARVKVWLVMLALIATQFLIIGQFLEYDVYAHLAEYAETDTQQQVAILGLLFLSVLTARRGYYVYENRPLQFVGVIAMLVAYGLAGQFAIEHYVAVDNPQLFIDAVGLVALAYFTLLYWYAWWSSAEFYAWDAKAVIMLLAVVLLGIAGLYAPPIMFAAFIVAFVPMLMHMFHTIGVLDRVNLKPFRHGMRLYIAIFGFWVELTVYFGRAMKRIVF